jgi:hypothetical protein
LEEAARAGSGTESSAYALEAPGSAAKSGADAPAHGVLVRNRMLVSLRGWGGELGNLKP